MQQRDSNLTIPNVLSIVRILLTPAFVMAFSVRRFDVALMLFAVAGATDALDGFLARLLRQRSYLGAILDPLADKILLDTAYICLALEALVPSWLSIVVISRDLIIVGGLLFLSFLGVDVEYKILPSKVSKVTTLFQIVLVFFIMISSYLNISWPVFVWGLTGTTTVLTVISGTGYLITGFKYLPSEEGKSE